jgi:hypothetical protein
MNSDTKTAVDEDFGEQPDFIKYPRYQVVSVFPDSTKVEAAVSDLRGNNFSSDDIEAFCGWESTDPKIFEGAKPGVWNQFIHAAKHVGPERIYIERYERHLRDGDCLIMVKVANKEQKASAAEILHRYTDERVTYFGLLAADEIQ